MRSSTAGPSSFFNACLKLVCEWIGRRRKRFCSPACIRSQCDLSLSLDTAGRSLGHGIRRHRTCEYSAKLFYLFVPRLSLHLPRDRELRARDSGLHDRPKLMEKIELVSSDSQNTPQLLRLRNRARDDRKSGREVLAELQRICRQRKVIDDEREHCRVESLCITRQQRIWARAQQMYVLDAVDDPNVRHVLSNEDKIPVGFGSGQEPNQFEIHPIRNQPKEADGRPFQRFHFFRQNGFGVAGFPKMTDIDAVRDEERTRVVLALVCEEPVG